MNKTELVLDGLNCSNCASKIERSIKKLDYIDSANLNFITKTVKIKTSNIDNIDDIIAEIQNIVLKYEPDVVVKEKNIDNITKKSLVLLGMVCTSCGAKIENRIKNLKGVRSANINYSTGKLTIETYDNVNLESINKKSQSIIKEVEPDVEIIDEENSDENKINESKMNLANYNKKILTRIITGAILFGIGIIFDISYWFNISMLILAYIIVGGDILLKAIKNISKGQIFDENFLMSIATLGAISIGEYPEGVAVMLFYQVGEFFQDLAVNKSRNSIKSLMDIRPDYANLKTNNDSKKVSPEKVKIGDLIIVKPGEKIPLDGDIIDGKSMVDTSALTGESVPRTVTEGDEVLGGFINNNGVLTIKVTKNFDESTVSKILDLVENASGRKAPTEQFITKFSRYYTPVVVISAALLAILPPLLLSGATFTTWLYRSLVFLVISCPCALVVSIPLGFFGGIGSASKNGVLVKGGNYLEALNDVKITVFDKTGTLTEGVFEVTEIKATKDIGEERLLEYAALAEVFSNHPIAKSILNKYNKTIDKSIIKNYNEVSGHGIKINIEDKEILVGNTKLMNKENISFEKVNKSGTIIYISVNSEYKGYIVISDKIKPDSKDTIKTLKNIGINRTVMLTGDNSNVGSKIGEDLNIDEVYAELLPDEKVQKLEDIESNKDTKEKVAFIGDGINDAPVLARSDIGIAMGGLGSDAAIEAADVVLMTDEPSKLITAINIAKYTRKIVYQNIIFALGIKGIVLLLGALGFASMWAAVFADVGVALLAILNSLRILKTKEV